jgi:hypothetical protein
MPAGGDEEPAVTTLTSQERLVDRGGDALDGFFDSLLSSNPFIDNRVNGPAADGVDVDDIHRTQFDQLTALARQARDLRRGVGVMLLGEAGVGKSHLLSRLLRWADHDQQALAVYLHNLQASPDNLPRSLLKSVVSILTAGRGRGFRVTPLYLLALALLSEALHHNKSIVHPWDAAARAYGTLLDGLAREESSRAAPVDRTIYNVLYGFLRSSYEAHQTRDESQASLAVRWLSGDGLDPAEGRRLGLPPGRAPDEPAALADNQQIKQVLVALSRAALSWGRPFLLCFDQVDNLDADQAAALSRFLEAVIDSAPNLLVVTAGVQATLLRWREMKVFQDSAWDRLAQLEVPLHRLTPQEGRRIVAARLEKAVTPFVELEPVRLRLAEDDLFPLGRPWAEVFFRDKIHLRPRDAINGAREGWRREQESLRKLGGAAWLEQWGRRPPADGETPSAEWTPSQIQGAIDRKTAEKIAEHCEQRRRRPEALPPDADNLAGLIAALVGRLGGVEINRLQSGKPDQPYPFTLKARRGPAWPGTALTTGLLVLVNDVAVSTTAALRRLLDAANQVDRVLLVTDERRPLALGKQPDAKGRQYYQDLQRGGPSRFRHVVLTLEQYVRLDALQAVAGMARSGDLEIELPGGKTRQVSEAEAIESHHRQGRFRSAPVLGDLFAETPLDGAAGTSSTVGA